MRRGILTFALAAAALAAPATTFALPPSNPTATMTAPTTAGPATDCPQVAPRTVANTGDVLEYGILDPAGRYLYYSDETKNAVMRMDPAHPSAAPVQVAAIPAPGAIVWRNGALIVGSGDSFENGLQGDSNPASKLVQIDPSTGAVRTYATGLGMANGVAQGPDGTIYTTNDGGFGVDRIDPHGHVTHNWATVFSANGAVVSGNQLLLSQTFTFAAIQSVDLSNPSNVTTYASAGAANMTAGLDDMAQGPDGTLYVAANGAGQVWKLTTDRRICVLASGLLFPSSVTIAGHDLWVVGFGGEIAKLPAVL